MGFWLPWIFCCENDSQGYHTFYFMPHVVESHFNSCSYLLLCFFILPAFWITSWVLRSQQQLTFSANMGTSFTLKGKLLRFQFVSHFLKIHYCSARSWRVFPDKSYEAQPWQSTRKFLVQHWFNLAKARNDSPNGWKTHLSLMTCGCQFQLVSRCVWLRN